MFSGWSVRPSLIDSLGTATVGMSVAIVFSCFSVFLASCEMRGGFLSHRGPVKPCSPILEGARHLAATDQEKKPPPTISMPRTSR
jgi:hypothetical protein